MSSLNVRVSSETHQKVRQLANREGRSMQSVIEAAIEGYRRKQFLEEANRQFAALRANPKAWQEEEEERAAWDATLLDNQEQA